MTPDAPGREEAGCARWRDGAGCEERGAASARIRQARSRLPARFYAVVPFVSRISETKRSNR